MSLDGNPSPSTQARDIIDNLVDIGATWARYGLNVGKTALETSAKTLNTSAEVLGDLAKRFEHAPGQKTPHA
jgi:hypothetical protein